MRRSSYGGSGFSKLVENHGRSIGEATCIPSLGCRDGIDATHYPWASRAAADLETRVQGPLRLTQLFRVIFSVDAVNTVGRGVDSKARSGLIIWGGQTRQAGHPH